MSLRHCHIRHGAPVDRMVFDYHIRGEDNLIEVDQMRIY